MPNDIEFLSRPIGAFDILAGIRYATAFDGKGRCVGRSRQVTRCKRAMERIVSSSGTRPRADGAVTLSLVRRALEDRYLRTGEVVEAHCSLCPHRRRGVCAGWTDRSKG